MNQINYVKKIFNYLNYQQLKRIEISKELRNLGQFLKKTRTLKAFSNLT